MNDDGVHPKHLDISISEFIYKDNIEKSSGELGCYHCLETYPASVIIENDDWCYDGPNEREMAICPCAVDAVVDMKGRTVEWLKEMEQYWFTY